MISSIGTSADNRPAIEETMVRDRTARIVVGIPAYNEEIAISGIVLRSLKYADVVVVDDCSNDHTNEAATLAGGVVIKHASNQGKGAAIKDLFHYAKELNAEILVLLDGDGQHDPDEIPLLLKPLLAGKADIVIGSRFLEKEKHNVPKYRRIGQEVLTVATNIASGSYITDSQSGFRAFSSSTFDCFSFCEYGMGIESEMIIDATKANLKIKEVPVNIRYDVDGSTFHPIIHGCSVLYTILKHMTQSRPILLFGIPVLFLLLIGIAGSQLPIGTSSPVEKFVIYVLEGLLCGGLGFFMGMVKYPTQQVKKEDQNSL